MSAQKKQSTINLLPSDELPVSIWGRILRWLLTTFRFMVIAVELVVVIGFLSRFFLDTQNSDLTDEIHQKKALIESYLPFEKNFKLAQAQLATISEFSDPLKVSSPVLNRITTIIPASIQLVSYANREGLLELRLASTSEAAVSQFVETLSKEADFQNVNVSQIENHGGGALVNFTINAQLKQGKEGPEDVSTLAN